MAEFTTYTTGDDTSVSTTPRRVFRNSAFAPATPTYHWTEDAACGPSGTSAHAGDYVWWDAVALTAKNPDDISTRQARQICNVCPVRQTCLMDAIAKGDDGFRGGMTYAERRTYAETGQLVESQPEPTGCKYGHGEDELIYRALKNSQGHTYFVRNCRVCRRNANREHMRRKRAS